MVQSIGTIFYQTNDFSTIKDAYYFFMKICHEHGYEWHQIDEKQNDSMVIAEAGGIGCDYRITLTHYY